MRTISIRRTLSVVCVFGLLLALSISVAAPVQAGANPSSTFSQGTLTVSGGNKGDHIAVECVGGSTKVNTVDPSSGALACTKVKSLVINGRDGNDNIDLFYVDAIAFPNIASTTAIGGRGRDSLDGSDLSDILIGSGGNDTLQGFDGDDVANGGGGRDIVVEANVPGTLVVKDHEMSGLGIGTDALSGIEAVSAYGDNGPNTLLAGTSTIDVAYNAQSGGSTQVGGDGDDTLGGVDGNDIINGSAGNDSLEGREGTNTLNGGAGSDTVSDVVFGANITLTDTSLTGTGSASTLIGIEEAAITAYGGGAHTIDATAFTGDTSLAGDGGIDTILGGSGDDLMMTGFGFANDSVDGNAGKDAILAYQLGDATITGTTIVSTDNGTDTFVDTERVILDANNDVVVFDASASAVPVAMIGQNGLNLMIGSPFADSLVGGDERDTLEGKAGNDKLDGADGKDTCKGGPGRDRLTNCE